MGSGDYIPHGDDKLLEWAKNLKVYAAANCSKWGVESPDVRLGAPLVDFEAKLIGAANPNRGKIDVMLKKEAQAALVKACRTYVQGFLARNPNVSDVDRQAMGITVYDVIPTNVPPPKLPVDGDLYYPAAGLVEIRNIRPVGDHPDPRADYGVRIYYGILGEPDDKDRFRVSAPPKTGGDLPHSIFTRQKKHRFDFAGDNGKEVFFCMRFENSKGQAGPWGNVLKTYIP
jgi:hypothetical protein